MNQFLSRAEIISAILAADTDSLWNKIRKCNKNYAPHEITIDDSDKKYANRELESEDKVKIEEVIILDDDNNEVDIECKSVIGSFLFDIIECLRKKLSKPATMINECSNDKFSLVEYFHDHNVWIESEAIQHMRKKINYQIDLIGYYHTLRA